MSFQDLNISRSYESDCGNLIQIFYEPVLEYAVKYFRLAGFFSSSSLAIAARGLAPFIKNGGKYLLICNPLLSKEDAKMISDNVNQYPLDIDLQLDNLEDEFERDHVKALGWMLNRNLLEIKLAIVYDEKGEPITVDSVSKNGIFHQKVGILIDSDGNILSFSGSMNESATAWLKNDEEFKVFRSWDETKPYVDSDLKRFQSYWMNEKGKTRVFDLPEAVKSDLIRYSNDFNLENFAAKEYLSSHNQTDSKLEKYKVPLFGYQEEAVKRWIDNDYRLLFEMATGTGKTRTAIACIAHLLNSNKKLVIVVSCPQSTLSRQWGKEFSNLGIITDKIIIADSTNPRWVSQLETALLTMENGFVETVLILTTHATSSKPNFTNILTSQNIEIAFVGDETHWLGAGKLKKALKSSYKYRIGLSATPSRWFDDIGSQIITEYYGATNFEFGISDALFTINPLTQKPFLVNFMYNLIDVQLNEEEAYEYKNLTQRLMRAYSKRYSSEDAQARYQRLLIKRAEIVKNAESKYEALERLLIQLKEEDSLQDLILFVSPQQIDKVKSILSDLNILSHELTEKQGTSKKSEYGGISEREHILNNFRTGQYKAIVAIKCLDEGIDIPTASRGILMASSTNPREYVQRIGRIIRQSPGKHRAYLYDMAVLGIGCLSDEEQRLDAKLRNKEIVRIREIAKNSLNGYDAERIINKYT